MVRTFHHPPAGELTLDGILHALSDASRRDIVKKLLAKGSMNCSEACEALPPSTVSHHHRILREAGLIRSERRGVEVVNSVRRHDVNLRFPGLLDAILGQHNT
ncbi:ArsR/SmtB family transcription factor [Ancylobacter mangrovi]|uniref:ArsR/SmtB family transcription factor n=1 Tax=Ancylobacter mangrovi TaxID=2972472 RepID=UPI0021635E6E|nr:metalloregulator ArsR/SmtB family transcription factor [Ancylobacter mangrovi]MCS0504744.1 helix-turn-helix domain-containing protein [Ancylobacter mangrovi]